MRTLDYRIVTLALAPWMLLGCTGDDVPVDPTGDTGSSSTGVSPTTTSSTTLPPPTTTTSPGTTTDEPETSSSGSTAAADESTTTTQGVDPCDLSVCGDNIRDPMCEVCDLAQLGGETCVSQGFQGGQLGCLLTCDAYNYLGCFICGNEVVDIAEDCEGTVEDGTTCESLGFEGGELVCGDDCLFDLSDCSICGDGIRQGPEQCDGIDLGGETCASLGFDGGNLGCNIPLCAYDYQGCSGGQYIQDFESVGGMFPPEFTVDIANPWTVDNTMPVNGMFSARSGAFPVGVGGLTNLSLTASFPVAGNVSFVRETSCANGVDFLEFYVDGVFQQSWTGIIAPAAHNQAVAAGMHTFQWRFNRAGFLDEGQNAVWVDDIVLTGGVPL
ncbi:MAG: hypothetical protein KC501_33125 [Myxococcales bacterium]|nr:hypothetical protein [Myxococcales bacterium]